MQEFPFDFDPKTLSALQRLALEKGFDVQQVVMDAGGRDSYPNIQSPTRKTKPTRTLQTTSDANSAPSTTPWRKSGSCPASEAAGSSLINC